MVHQEIAKEIQGWNVNFIIRFTCRVTFRLVLSWPLKAMNPLFPLQKAICWWSLSHQSFTTVPRAKRHRILKNIPLKILIKQYKLINLCYMSLFIGVITNNGSPYCDRLTVGYGDLTEFRKEIKIHLSSQVPQDWPNSHFPEDIHVLISLHTYWKNFTQDLQDWFKWHPTGCSAVRHNAAEIKNAVTSCSTMYPQTKLMLLSVRLDKINYLKNLLIISKVIWLRQWAYTHKHTLFHIRLLLSSYIPE
jgi:hypothetical protein